MKNLFYLGIIVLLSLLIFLLSLMTGQVSIPFYDFLSVLGSTADEITARIILDNRLPRSIAAFLVGGALACGGNVFQVILKNPLAEPYTLGVSSGAALGAALALMLGLHFLLTPLAAFAGAFTNILILYTIASVRKFNNFALILGGVVLSFFFSSLIVFIYTLGDHTRVYQTVMWLAGNLSSIPTKVLSVAGSLIFLICIFIFYEHKNLNLLSMGDEQAYYFGLNVVRFKKIMFVLVSLMTAAAVSLSGIIGFVGLIIPHLMRGIFGSDSKVMVPASFFAGAAFLSLCDIISRILVHETELPVGVITGICGGIFFTIMLLNLKRTEAF